MGKPKQKRKPDTGPRVQIRFMDEEQRRAWMKLAKREGLTISSWIRHKITQIIADEEGGSRAA